jgi:DNA-binding beta-propeller fold protein YncE
MGASLVSFLYVVDAGNNRVQAFDYEGNFKFQFGSYGTANGYFNEPNSICTDGEKLYVTDSGNDRVQVFDLLGNYLFQFGTTGSEVGEFDTPRGIATDGKFLYVVDQGNSRFQVFTMFGLALLAIGSYGTGANQFVLPTTIAVDSAYVYVKDSNGVKTFQKYWIPDVYMAASMGMDTVSMVAEISAKFLNGEMSMDSALIVSTMGTVSSIETTMSLDEVEIHLNITNQIAVLNSSMSIDVAAIACKPGILGDILSSMSMDRARIVMKVGKLASISGSMDMDTSEFTAYITGPAYIVDTMPMDYCEMISIRGM